MCWGDTNEPKPLNTAAVIKKNNLQNPRKGEAARVCELEFYQVTYARFTDGTIETELVEKLINE